MPELGLELCIPNPDFGDLKRCIEASLLEQSLQLHDKLLLKTTQFFEVTQVRFGVCLVGPTMGGKSTAYKTLGMALTKLREEEHEDEQRERAAGELSA